MNKMEIILDNYPNILAMQKANFNFREISENFISRGIDIPYNSLKPTVSKIKNKSIHPEYDKIVMLTSDYESRKIYEPYSIQFNGIWICFKDSPSIKEEWIITEKILIKSIADPVGILYAKRFLKAYHLSDKLLLQKYIEYWKDELLPSQIEKTKLVSENIKTDFENIVSELKKKNLEYIFRDDK